MKHDLSAGVEGVALLERLTRLVRAREHEADLNPAQWEAMRYLSRCNRYSDSPSALTAYVGATKGTVSQTINALVRKGLVAKRPRDGERRSVRLELTEAGRRHLEHDPWQDVSKQIDAIPLVIWNALRSNLSELLRNELKRRGNAPFGRCMTCRNFERNKPGTPDGAPHYCRLLEEPLSDADAGQLCVEHRPLLDA